jgi:hypothetical protein
MGREFFYCSNCQTRLGGDEFESGRAARFRDQVACETCLGELIAPLSLKEQEQILLEVRTAKEQARERRASGRVPTPPHAVPTVRPPSSIHSTAVRSSPRPPVPVPQKSHAGLIVFIGLVVLLGTFAYFFLYLGPSVEYTPVKPESAAAPRPPRPEPAPKRPAAEAEKDKAVASSLDSARAFARVSPNDLPGQLERYRQALAEAAGTPAAAEIQGEIDATLAKLKASLAADLAALDPQVAEACGREEFGRAVSLLEDARRRHPSSEWTNGVDARIRDVHQKHAWNAFIPLRDRFALAKKTNGADDMKAVSDRVARWGLPSFVKELDRIASGEAAAPAPPADPAPAPPPGPASAEAKAWAKPWLEQAALAGAREYDAALAGLERAAAALKEADAKSEAQADLELFRSAAGAYRDAVQVLAQWPKGQPVPLEFLDEDGRTQRASDPLVRAEAGSVSVLRGGDVVTVELSEITARGLGEILKSRAAENARPAALLCLFEGDVEGASALLSGPRDGIPWKYWSQAAKLAEARANPRTESAKKELAARHLYFAAERERRNPATRAAAIDKYRALLNDHADSALVKARRTHIAAQRDAAKEFVFLAEDLRGSGHLKLSKVPKLGSALLSEAESTAAGKGKDSAADLQFYALPDAAYRCWAYVGGCCQQTLTFYYQATDLAVPHPDDRKILLNADPGGSTAPELKPPIPFLKKRHDDHGGPKEPKRWDWALVPLPKFPAAGLKSIRLITEERGFAIAAVVVSSVRSAPPLESEFKAWLKADAAEDAPGPAAVEPGRRDPALVGHWRLDDAGGTALDASGHDNTGVLVGEPARAAGKVGNALAMDGKDRYVNIPASSSLEKVHDGNYTLSAWFKAHSRPPGADPSANDAAFAILMKAGQEGLKYGADQKFTMDHWLGTQTGVSVTTGNPFPPGAFHHVAAVVSRAEGAVRLYVNGRLEGQGTFAAGAAGRDFGQETWKIGIASPGAATHRWCADATIDDVRIHTRALNANDLKVLAGGATAPPLAVSLLTPGPSDRFDSGDTITLNAFVQNAEPGRVAKVEFWLGPALLGSDAAAPYAFSWGKVSSGVYSVTVRAVDRSGASFSSLPVTVRVGGTSLFRAVNLGGGALKLDGIDFEGKGAKGVAVTGTITERGAAELFPPVEGARASLLQTSVCGKDGVRIAFDPMPNGSYQAWLHVVSAGEQPVDFSAEGKTVFPKLSLGPAGRWERVGPFDVTVTDGVLDFAARGGEAHLAGVEIWRIMR